jgi:hypothetical protein
MYHCYLQATGSAPSVLPLNPPSVTLGSQFFQSRHEYNRYFRTLLSNPLDYIFTPDQFQTVFHMLQYHHRSCEKLGEGIAQMKIGIPEQNQHQRCLIIKRIDGTEVDVSYIKVGKNIFPM